MLNFPRVVGVAGLTCRGQGSGPPRPWEDPPEARDAGRSWELRAGGGRAQRSRAGPEADRSQVGVENAGWGSRGSRGCEGGGG